MRSAATVATLALLLVFSSPSTARPTERCPLRVALVQGNAAQATQAADGSYRGISVDLANTLARKWGRRATVTAMSPPQILAAIERRELDLGFVAINADRPGAVAYSRPYMLVQQSAMVSAASPLKSVKELDQPGIRIGVNAGDSVAGYLVRTLTSATVVTSTDIALGEAATWLRDGRVAAFAGNRQRLGTAALVHGLWLLPDNFYAVPQAIVVASADPVMLAATQAALDDLQASGAVAAAIRRSGVAGVDPVPVSRNTRPNGVAKPRCPG